MRRWLGLGQLSVILRLGLLIGVSCGFFPGVGQGRVQGDSQVETRNGGGTRSPMAGTGSRSAASGPCVASDQRTSAWSTAIPTLLAVIVGGALSIGGVWLKDTRDRRRAIQEWLEAEFIFGGIEPVVCTLDRMRLLLVQREVSLVRVDPNGGFPVTELAKLRIVIGSDRLSVFIQVLGRLVMRAAGDRLRGEEIAKIAGDLMRHLDQLERLLLQANLSEKGAIYRLAERSPFRQVTEAVDSSCRKLEDISKEDQKA